MVVTNTKMYQKTKNESLSSIEKILENVKKRLIIIIITLKSNDL